MMNKTLIAAAAATAIGFAGMASAETYITLQPEMMQSDQVTLTTVVADADGYVAIYDYRLGEPGDLLGTAPIVAGANSNVIVTFETPVNFDVLAVVYNGEVTTPDMAAFTEEVMIEN